jgi:hypothetical protein
MYISNKKLFIINNNHAKNKKGELEWKNLKICIRLTKHCDLN